MLEVDIDVGRFVALFRYESLEQQMQPRWVDFGDVEAIADGGICRRSATLTEDVLAACELNDVIYGEEKVLVVQLLDEIEFRLDQLFDVFRHTGRPALGCTRKRDLS